MAELFIAVRLKDPAEWTKGKLLKLANKFPEEFIRGMWQATYVVLRRIQDNISGPILNVRSGRLRSSFLADVKREVSGNVVGTVGSNVVYAAIHEFGGIILPKRGAFLVFKIADKWIKTRRVVMPARRYASKSLSESQEEAFEVLGEVVTKLMNRAVQSGPLN